MSENRPDCYKCIHRGNTAGSTHSSCHHPSTKKVMDDPMMQAMAIFASVGRIEPFIASSGAIKVQGHPHGIARGWFNWPFNFDPCWLMSCEGYTNNEEVVNG